jgi:hypothetical protein
MSSIISTLISKIKINKFLGLIILTILIPALVLGFLNSFTGLNDSQKSKSAGAAGPNTGDLIIGTKDTGNAIELSVCVKATPGPFRLSQVSNWFKFDPSALTPTPSTFLEKGQYGNTAVGLNGYSPIKWLEVNGTLNTTTIPNSDTYTMSLAYGGDGVTPNLAGLFMSTTTPELYGKVSFAKIPNSTGSNSITMVKNQFFTIENGVGLTQQVINVTGDCRNSVCPANTTSANGYIAPNPCTSTCPSGDYLDTTTSVCKICPANSFCVPGTTTPTACAVGQSSPTGSTLVIQCVSPCTNGASNPPSCNQCPAGQYFNSSACSPCPEGSYCTNPQPCTTTTCQPPTCPAGQTSPAGATSQSQCYNPVCANGATNSPACTTCPAGTSYITASSSCVTCTVGQYCPGPLPPAPCPANSYCPTPGPAPIPCPANTASPIGSISISACVSNCPVGKYLNTTANTCDSCPANSTSLINATGPTSCYSTCVAGTTLNTTTNICTPCPANSFCPTPQACSSNTNCPPVIPTPCPAGQTSPAGATSQSQCYNPVCANGATNSPACTTCPAGTSYITASSSCVTCTVGQYCPGPLPPAPCPANSYCPTPGPAPIPCPTGQFSPSGSVNLAACVTPACTNGATNPSACTICLVGNYIYNGNCTICPANFVCIVLPCNPNCPPVIPTPCPIGTFAPAGSISLSSCSQQSGEVIIIKLTSSSSTQSSSSEQKPTVLTNSTFQSLLRITDPYICGVGSYGNVPNAKDFGVDAVYYDFYKKGSDFSSYSYKLKLNAEGDFFLPISSQTNLISEGSYKIVFYATDKNGGKAQGEYNAYITNDCKSQGLDYTNTNDSKGSYNYDSIRTGGFSVFATLVAMLLMSMSYYIYKKSKVKKLYYESKNTDEF